MAINNDDLQRWQELCDAADPGPWWAVIDRDNGLTTKISIVGDDPCMPGKINIMYYRHAEQNAQFIAAARTLVPELIAEIKRLRKGMEVHGIYECN